MSATRPTERDVMSADFDLALEEYLYTLTDEEFEALVARTESRHSKPNAKPDPPVPQKPNAVSEREPNESLPSPHCPLHLQHHPC